MRSCYIGLTSVLGQTPTCASVSVSRSQVWDQALIRSENLTDSSPEISSALKIIICHTVSRI